jgi:nitroimidazol reductase NimA-like FMN-containing flavoprotein (pyridoxamine 5'-phosphate oxidase superfamily)
VGHVETWLEELGEPVCRRLLAAATIGRLGVIVDGHPEIFPVNHVWDEPTGCVVFPSNARTKLHAATAGSPVAFEVDGLDDGGRSAWSVVVRGMADELDDPEAVARVAAARVPLWAVGPYTHWLRIQPEHVSGRRISTLP